MKYMFRCDNHVRPFIFEKEQRMNAQHVADCPICHVPARRMYTAPVYYFPNVLWNKDGSRQDPSELPEAPQDQNWGWSGFGDGSMTRRVE